MTYVGSVINSVPFTNGRQSLTMSMSKKDMVRTGQIRYVGQCNCGVGTKLSLLHHANALGRHKFEVAPQLIDPVFSPW